MNKTTIQFQGKHYEIPFPNMGQYMDIEQMKLDLTGGKYAMMSLNAATMNPMSVILDVVDAVSTFTILQPELKEEIGGKNFDVKKLDMDGSLMELVEQYRKVFIPFYDQYVDSKGLRSLFRIPELQEETKKDVKG